MDLRRRVPNIMALKRKLGMSSYSRLHGILKGTSRAGVERAKQIEAETDGAIRRWELRPDVWDAPQEDPPPPLDLAG